MQDARYRRTAEQGGDWIHLRKVKATCILGIHPAERTHLRPVLFDVSLEIDSRRAAKSDKIGDTLNYELVEAETIKVAEQGKCFLIEALAERVAEACLRHQQVGAVRVVVDKPGALPHTESIAVEILRRR
ncbi:MAG: dihydroneopterin aldolase [Kiritimatiellia bacterium]